MSAIKLVSFKDLMSLRGKKIKPAFLYFSKTVYQLESWYELMKVFFWKLFQEEKGKTAILEAENKGLFNQPYAFISSMKEFLTGAEKIVKFSDTLYVRVQETKSVLQNLNLIRYFQVAFSSSYGTFRIYITEEGEEPSKEELNQFLSEQKKNKRIIKQGKGLVAHINGLILSDQEKLLRRIAKEFQEKRFIGDIVLNETEEKALNALMRFELARLKESPAAFKPISGEAFALGVILYGQKYYSEGNFWRGIKAEYDLEITSNHQTVINRIVLDVLKRHKKDIVTESKGAVDTICMHSFVTTPCANKLFDYLFDYWRLDLDRNAENLYGENGADNFDILIDEIEANKDQSKNNLMIHTTYALLNNRIGSKVRLKKYLNLIDRCFWDHEAIPDSQTRIIRLLKEWTENPAGKFQKETKKKDYKAARGETLLLRPTLFINYETYSFKLRLHQQRLPNCTEEDAVGMQWHISYDDGPETILPTVPLKGKAGIYTKETELNPFDPENLFSKIGARLVSPTLDKPLFNKAIRSDTVRFFDAKGRYIDHHTATVPVGTVFAFYNTEPPLVAGKTFDPYQMEGYGVVQLKLEKGDLIQLPDGTSVLAGERISDGLLDTDLVFGAEIDSKPIYSKLPSVLVQCKKAEIEGAFLILNDNGKPIKLDKSFTTEFKLSDGAEDVYGYLVDLSKLPIAEGLVKILLKTNGKKQISDEFYYLKGFTYAFEDAPYVFKETGSIVFPSASGVVKKGNDWDVSIKQSRLTFAIEPNKTPGYSVEKRSLFLKYMLGSEELEIEFPIPSLYWRFSEKDTWNHIKPQPVFFKNIPEYVYFTGPFDWRSVRVQADLSEFDVESEGIVSSEPSEDGTIKYKVDQIKSWIVDRSKDKVSVLLTISGVGHSFLDVYCHSIIIDHQVFGDFENKRLFGTFEIEGGGDYTLSIYHNEEKVEDDISIEPDGSFEIDTDLQEGNYEFYLYENETSEGFFEEDEISIPLNKNRPIIARLRDITNLAGTIYRVRSIQWLKKQYAPDPISYPTFIQVVGAVDAQHLLDLENADYEDDDEFIINSRTYDEDHEELLDTNTVIYEGKLFERIAGKYEFRYWVILIFQNKFRPQRPIVLRNVKEDSGINPLLYDRVACRLIKTDQLEKYNKTKGLRRKEIRELDDNLYGLNLVVEEQ